MGIERLYESTAMDINIDALVSLSGIDLTNYVIATSSMRKKALLKNEKVRALFFEAQNHYAFIWLIQKLKEEELLYFCDEELISFLEKDLRLADKLNAIISSENKSASSFLSHPVVIELIFKENSSLNFIMNSSVLDIDFGKKYFSFLKNNHPEAIDDLNYLADDVVIELMSENLDYVIESGYLKEYLISASPKVTEKIIENSLVELEFLKLSVMEIDMKIEKGLVLPAHVYNNSLFLKKYLEIEDVSQYRNKINRLASVSLSSVDLIEKKRKQYYLEQLNGLNLENGMLPKYQNLYDRLETDLDFRQFKYGDGRVLFEDISKISNKEDLYQIMLKKSEKEALEMMIDFVYEEVAFDFISATRIMLEYNNSLAESVLSNERLALYQMFDQYADLSVSERINFFNSLAGNEMENFYDDFKVCREKSYQAINDNLFRIENMSGLKNNDLSEKYQLPIYQLEGEQFQMLVTATAMDRKKEKLNLNHDRSTSSCSVIGDKHIKVKNENNIVLGFADFDIDKVLHLHQTDSFTAYESLSTLHTKVFTPDQLLRNTSGYNELLYSNTNFVDGEKEHQSLKPSYVVAYDRIETGDLLYARSCNIPIVVINSSKYQKKDGVLGTSYGLSNYGGIDDDYYRKR